MDRSLPVSAGDMGLIPVPGRFHMLRATKAPVPQLLKPVHLEPPLHSTRTTATGVPSPQHERAHPEQQVGAAEINT